MAFLDLHLLVLLQQGVYWQELDIVLALKEAKVKIFVALNDAEFVLLCLLRQVLL